METLLTVENLVKRFGAVIATDHLNLDVRPGEIHALIGPNGAGKTTLINQIEGELRPDTGRIFFRNRDITRLAVHRRAVIGLARTFQITNIFNGFSAVDNVALAIQARAGHSFRFWKDVRSVRRLREPAAAILAMVGINGTVGIPAGQLSYGEQRQVGIAMALAVEPKLLLLDEPMAGMDAEASRAMVALLRRLKGRQALLLVEHDMDAVFNLADRISVLVYGQVIATGTPDEIRRNREVLEAYLGEEPDHD
jgi:branched-chain amino acid transport system ATP-binding protein